MITVAPPTHTFGTIHTERHGHATLFLGNPTFADAEWSLSHVPAPPPKERASQNWAVNTAATPANTDVRIGVGAGQRWATGVPGGTDAPIAAAAASGASSGKLGGKGSPVNAPSSIRGASRGRLREGTDAGRRLKSLVVDDPSVFVFGEEIGVIAGVKLPLKSSAACLPEDWSRFEVRRAEHSPSFVVLRNKYFLRVEDNAIVAPLIRCMLDKAKSNDLLTGGG